MEFDIGSQDDHYIDMQVIQDEKEQTATAFFFSVDPTPKNLHRFIYTVLFPCISYYCRKEFADTE